jgi:hypothetical protein
MTPPKINHLTGIMLLFLALLTGRLQAQPVDEMILAWTGQSEMGFVRVELWSPDAKDPQSSRLVIKCASLEGVTIHLGRMVRLPPDIRNDDGVNQIFVASAEEIKKYQRYGDPVVASIASDGTLRLYVVGFYDFRVRPTLKPT